MKFFRFMQRIIGILYWAGAFMVRIPLILIGLIAVAFSVAGDGYKRTPKMWKFFADAASTPAKYTSRGGVYWYWAIRNPTRGYKFEQKTAETHPNPDYLVRNGVQKAAHREMMYHQHWEYWYLRKVGDKYFEFRVGFKYTTGGDIKFGPTLQLRLGD